MTLDFNNTCPLIDNTIEEIQEEIDSRLGDLLELICPYIDSVKKQDLIDEFVNDVHDNFIVGKLEDVRQNNSDMRDQADKQLEELNDELIDMTKQYDDLYYST